MPTKEHEARPPQRSEVPLRNDNPLPPEDNEHTRRTALKMFSAAGLLAMGVGCTRKPKRHIISMVERPEYMPPGKALHYASTWTEGSKPYGIMVKSLDGRPVKVDGLPSHPVNRGKSDAQMQATLLGLYDPARLRTPLQGGEASTWDAADKAVVAALKASKRAVLVTRALLGPAERAMVTSFLGAVPGSRHIVHEPVSDARRAAWKELYGSDGEIEPRLANANVVLSLDSDFLGTDGDVISQTRDYTARRKVSDAKASTLSRLYVAESAMTVTGSNADNRVPLKPSQMLSFVDALRNGGSAPPGVDAKVFAGLVEDLKANTGKAVVLAGGHLPPAVHASVAMLNDKIGAPGRTLAWNPEPSNLPANDPRDVAAAVQGADVAIFLGVNPVYDGLDIAGVATTVGHGLTNNETLSACTIALPSAHNLESWNDAAPMPGVRSVCQPMIAPLFDGRQELESLLVWAKGLGVNALAKHKDAYDYVKASWSMGNWEDALRAGVVGTPRSTRFPGLNRTKASALASAGMGAAGSGPVDLVVLPHANVHDGRFSGLSWLMELPEPTSKLVWDNAAVMSPATAKTLGTKESDWVKVGDTKIPVLVQRGVAPNTVIVHMGYGRTAGAGTGDNVGVSAAPLMANGRLVLGATVSPADGAQHPMVRTQSTFDQRGRHLAASGTKDEYVQDNEFVKHRTHVPPLDQIDPEWDYTKTHKWAMAIDLSACTGCTSCVIACQSENNIVAVGKEECSQGRDMSWISLDRYESGPDENPVIDQQPMLCMHCDNAPCESVCPVNATVHDDEGLNLQVYNRCVGTRYCSNNCPYKVRRFNFLNYQRQLIEDPVQELMFNPNVTVRMRGVMEKCTFCLQRINAAKYEHANAGTTMPDGAVRTACQQACSADAITFGDVNAKNSAVKRARESDLAYNVLEELNVRPNVTYLARVRNPHPSTVEKKAAHGKGGHH